MVRNYVRKTGRKNWSVDGMRTAIEDVIKRGHSVQRAAKDNKVPKSTLSKRIHDYRCNPEKDIDSLISPMGAAYSRALSKDQEDLLCEYLKTLGNQMVDLHAFDIRRLAFELAEKLEIAHPFKKELEMAGADWYIGFMKRHPEIPVKKLKGNPPEKTQGFSKQKVYRFYESLENVIKENLIEAYDIYNLDETVITCGTKLVTSIICFSASGSYMPLTLIFPCEVNPKVLKDAPSGAMAEFNTTGQMEYSIFIKYLKMFTKYSKASKNSPVLLIINKYQSYLKKLEVLDILKENGVFIISVPEDCSHKLHPLVYNFIRTLGSAYSNEVRNNSQSVLSLEHVYRLFGNAFMKVSSVAIAVNGFRNTGIWPINRDLFESDFDLDTTTEELSIFKKKRSQSTSDLFKSAVEEACEDDMSDSSINNEEAPQTDTNEIIFEPEVITGSVNHQAMNVQQMRNTNQQNGDNIIQQPQPQPYAQPHFVPNQNIIQRSDQPVITENYSMGNQVYEQQQHSQHQHQQQQQDYTSSIIIPPEAKLTEVSFHDLQNLMQSQRPLYFYVSPYRLRL